MVGGVHGSERAWQGACMVGGVRCVGGACVAGETATVRILLEGILVWKYFYLCVEYCIGLTNPV